MISKKTKINSEKKVKKKSSEDSGEERIPKDEREIEEMLEEEMLGDLDEEDDEEFIHNVEEFKKGHLKGKMISVYKKIGKPKFTELNKLDPKKLKDELRRLIVALDTCNIIVHSHGEYDDREKYRFITEEIFKEFVEDDKKKHITFVYEDYHPEMEDDDEDEEVRNDDLI
ncbi:MAG: hypothetical protein IPL53_04695 [Ignavibacteria bacterium]|nr:hypothetical protein [Ignavibacteria bacterium]